jgi:hypothetical protein
MTAEFRNNQEQCRYELAIDERLVGIAEYRLVHEVVVFPHTEIERARRGQGLGAQLVQYALDDVRASKRRAKAECWYVTEFIAEHPEYADLVS